MTKTEGIVGVAQSVVGALKRDPLMLAFMVVVIVFLWFIQQGVRERREMDHEMMKQLLTTCLPTKP